MISLFDFCSQQLPFISLTKGRSLRENGVKAVNENDIVPLVMGCTGNKAVQSPETLPRERFLGGQTCLMIKKMLLK